MLRTLVGLVVVVLGLPPTCGVERAWASSITLFPASSYSSFTPRAVSADGSVVVGEAHRNSDLYSTYAFRWTVATGFQSIGMFNSLTSAYGLTADGVISVGTRGYPIPQAATWTTPGVEFLTLGIQSSTDTSCARACSLDGAVIVGERSSGGQAFRWTEPTGAVFMEGNSAAYACSADGTIVAGDSGDQAAIWDADNNLTILGKFASSAVSSTLVAISSDGSTASGYDTGGPPYSRRTAYRWTSAGGFAELGRLSDVNWSSNPTGMSGDGNTIVGRCTGGGFIWTASAGMRYAVDALSTDYDIDMTGWLISEVDAISRDGRTIVGLGRSPSGSYGMWVATVPEPSSAVAMGLLLCALASLRRSRMR